jgi:CRP-like cAMP-binding protein
LEISKSDFERLTNTYHDFERLARVVVTKTMLQLQQRIVAVQFETALQKYENLIALRPDITQRVALSHIASYLGITIETLSRIRKPKSGF